MSRKERGARGASGKSNGNPENAGCIEEAKTFWILRCAQNDAFATESQNKSAAEVLQSLP